MKRGGWWTRQGARARSLLPPALLVLFLVATPLASACGGDDEEPSSTSTGGRTSSTGARTPSTGGRTSSTGLPGTTASASSSSSTTKTSLLSSSEKDLGNGRVRVGGFIERAYEAEGEKRIDIDYADFLTGEEAEAAAAAVGEEVNNDYFIRNVSAQLRTFEVTATVFELPQGDPTAPLTGDWEEFREFLAEYPDTYWWMERQGREVVLLEGQWVP